MRLLIPFLCSSIPTTNWNRNVTWYPFSQFNLSYLHISEYSFMDINYRQNHYAFWREYMPVVESRWPSKTLTLVFIATKVLLGSLICFNAEFDMMGFSTHKLPHKIGEASLIIFPQFNIYIFNCGC